MDDQAAAKKIESVKAYYQQQVNQLRTLTQQLSQPDLAPARRSQLVQQQETLQRDLSVFVETVLKPLAAAAPRPTTSAMMRPPMPVRPPTMNKPQTQIPVVPPALPPHSLQAIQQQQWLFAQRVQNSRQFNDACYTQPRAKMPIPMAAVVEEAASAGSLTMPTPNGQCERESRLARSLSQMPNLRGRADEDELLQMADNWLDRVIMSAVLLAKHRQSATVAKKDVELALDRAAGFANYNTQAGLTGARKLLRRTAASGGGGNNPHHNRMAQLRRILKHE